MKWIAGGLLTIVCLVLGSLFLGWQGTADECSADLKGMQVTENGRWAAQNDLGNRVTAVETNMANIDKTLESIDRRLASIEKAVR